MKEWEKIIPELDREIYQRAGYGATQTFGRRPALLVIDMILGFTGTKPMETLDAIREFRSSCGKVAWQAIPRIRKLLRACRQQGIPVAYSTSDLDYKATFGNATKRVREATTMTDRSMEFPHIIRPRAGEFIVRKARASAFFGTHLITYLTRMGVDSLLVTGCTTSGCVRGTVLDGYSYGFSVFAVEDCVFDRSHFSHLVNLYEMNSKYATVITSEEAIHYLRKPAGREHLKAAGR
ncbi:MAG: isochorismatase family protein [Candidatus Binatia bacterium]|jgi:nicotinamidase-related amidase|nr:isochorismatase family protein [Candidatus Binatia bacterium]